VRKIGTDYDLNVITLDRDLSDVKPFPNIESNAWQNKSSYCDTYYLSKGSSLLYNFKDIFEYKSYDLIYLNSFFDYSFSIRFLTLYFCKILKCDTVLLAPRGELTVGAMSLKKKKKLLYLFIFKFLGLHKRIIFHFTSQEEYLEAKNYLGEVKYKIVPNMHEVPPEYQEKDKKKNELKLLYLSRISEKKNLLTVIQSLMSIVEEYSIQFTIVGAYDNKSYWDKCLKAIEKLPQNITVIIKGVLDREQVFDEFRKNEVYVLPTLNENYGHAIVEGMINSNMVIISDQTPWSELCNNGGFVGTPFDIKFYTKSIQKIASFDKQKFNTNSYKSYMYCHTNLKSNENKITQLFE